MKPLQAVCGGTSALHLSGTLLCMGQSPHFRAEFPSGSHAESSAAQGGLHRSAWAVEEGVRGQPSIIHTAQYTWENG